MNLHGAFGKSSVTKALEALTSRGEIVTKVFGKMNISVAKMVETENLNEMIDSTQQGINKLNDELDELESEIATLQEGKLYI